MALHNTPGENPAALRQALYELTLEATVRTAKIMAEALDLEMEAWLQFCGASAEAEILGKRARLRRLDRVWGGTPLKSLEALQNLHLVWPGPATGRLITLCPVALVNDRVVPPNGCALLPPGTELSLGQGALILLRRPAEAALLEAANAAGFSIPEIIRDLCQTEWAITTPAGTLLLQAGERKLTLKSRSIRLSPTETRALVALVRRPGALVARRELEQVLGLRQAHALDRVILNLRNKLGDGVISTIYGIGYVLEGAAAPRGLKAESGSDRLQRGNAVGDVDVQSEA